MWTWTGNTKAPVTESVVCTWVDAANHGTAVTVKPLMLACPLFREFREPNKTRKFKDANINCGPK